MILNGRAGGIKAQAEIEAELRGLFQQAGRGVDIVAPHSESRLSDAARDASRRASIVVAAGGDGTVSSVAAALAGSRAALGVLPLGTRNHFAKDLQIPLELRDAVAVVAAGRTGRIDAARVNDRLFINNCSIGVYPGAVEVREALRRQGHGRWRALAVAAWRAFRNYHGMSVEIAANGAVRTRRTPFVVVGNNAYTLDGLDMGGRARLDEGALFAYLTPRTRARDVPILMIKGLSRAARSGEFEILRAAALTVATRRAAAVRVAIDGEVATLDQPLRFRACPGALEVVLPSR